MVIHADGRIETLKHPCETPNEPQGWQEPDFDDSTWSRVRGGPFPSVKSTWANVSRWNVGSVSLNASSPCLAMMALRGKFEVTDPAHAGRLKLSVSYRGGVIVYVNGKEVSRKHMRVGTGALAEKYPREAYVYPDGSLLDHNYTKAEKVKDRYMLRTRKLADVNVPASLLRRGTNVVAIEIHRAPYDAFLIERTEGKEKTPHKVHYHLWDTCNLVGFRMTADGTEGLVPNVVRPKGIQVWSTDVLAADFDLDFGDPTEPLHPIEIVGTCGGSFSGKVVVGSTEPIKGLRATVTPLTRRGGGGIAPGAVRIRYAVLGGGEMLSQGHYPAAASRFDGLEETAPAEVPVRVKSKVRDNWVTPGQPKPVFGAVQPMWMTVTVPPDARAGDYDGTLTLTAEGIEPVRVPVHLQILDWRLPAARDFRTFVEIIPSPDSLAIKYDVPPWSDAHFKLIERSLRLIGEVGNKTVYVPLICHTNLGNAQSMVRWVPKPGGGYTYDFSIMKRYLDLYEKHCGRPEAVCIGVWEAFLEGGTLRYARKGRYAATEIWEDFDKAKGLGPLVTLVEPNTGKTRDLQLPLYTKEEKSKLLWQPLLAELRARLRKRHLERQMLLGYCHDAEPAKEVVTFFRELMPGVPWLRQAHSRRHNLHGVPYALQMLVWSSNFLVYPDVNYRGGWKKAYVQFPRNHRNNWPITSFSLMAEMNVMSYQRGFGRLGGSFWPLFKDKRGRPRGSVATRYPKVRWRNLAIATSMLAPGKDGPISTVRLEMIREGVQECEARIFIEDVLGDENKRKQLDASLAGRCEAMLRERTAAVLQGTSPHSVCGFLKSRGADWWNYPSQVGMHWYLQSERSKRTRKLYALAAEVAKVIEGK